MTPTDALRDILRWLDPHGNNRDCDAARAALAADDKDESELVAALEYIAARQDGVSSGTAFDQLAEFREVARKALAKHAK